jgi:predicted carbohydrate-binding protein with CBM5 and CBM33 domain
MSIRKRALATSLLAASVLTVLLVNPQPASAHGSAIDPPSRHYGCARRWDTSWQNPASRGTPPSPRTAPR